MSRSRFAAAALAAAFTLGWAGLGLAQDKPKDDELDRLLEKLEGHKPAPDAEAAPKPKKDEDKKDAAKDKAKEKDKPKPKPAAEPKDKALDSILEQLGETKEAPKTTGPSGGGKPEGADQPAPGAKPEDQSADKLTEGQKLLDRDLEERAGRIRKKKDQKDEGQPDDKSALGQAVKKMREVETKLGETDTGEETRKKQGEIVKDLDTLIAQAKKMGQGGKGKPGRRVQQAGPPGGPPDGQPGSQGDTARGAGPMKTVTAKNAAAQVGDKNTWGNLPAMLRDEMENVFRAEPLPKKMRLIGRYYESVSKKSLSSRGE